MKPNDDHGHENFVLPEGGLQIKIDSKNEPNLPYLKADIFQLSRIGNDFTMIIHQTNYQRVIEAARDGNNMIESNSTMALCKLVMDKEGFMRLKNEVDTLFNRWQSQAAKGMN